MGDKSLIALSDSPEEIAAKLKRAVTETTGVLVMKEDEVEHAMSHLAAGKKEDDRGRSEEEVRGQAGAWALISLLREFGSEKEAQRVVDGQPIRYGELKILVATRIADHFADYRKKRAALEKAPAKVWSVLKKGGVAARKRAQATMKEVRKLTGLR